MKGTGDFDIYQEVIGEHPLEKTPPSEELKQSNNKSKQRTVRKPTKTYDRTSKSPAHNPDPPEFVAVRKSKRIGHDTYRPQKRPNTAYQSPRTWGRGGKAYRHRSSFKSFDDFKKHHPNDFGHKNGQHNPRKNGRRRDHVRSDVYVPRTYSPKPSLPIAGGRGRGRDLSKKQFYSRQDRRPYEETYTSMGHLHLRKLIGTPIWRCDAIIKTIQTFRPLPGMNPIFSEKYWVDDPFCGRTEGYTFSSLMKCDTTAPEYFWYRFFVYFTSTIIDTCGKYGWQEMIALMFYFEGETSGKGLSCIHLWIKQLEKIAVQIADEYHSVSKMLTEGKNFYKKDSEDLEEVRMLSKKQLQLFSECYRTRYAVLSFLLLHIQAKRRHSTKCLAPVNVEVNPVAGRSFSKTILICYPMPEEVHEGLSKIQKLHKAM